MKTNLCIGTTIRGRSVEENFSLVYIIPLQIFIGILGLSLATTLLFAMITYGVAGEGLILRFSFLVFCYSSLFILLALGISALNLSKSSGMENIFAGLGSKVGAIFVLLSSGIGAFFTIKDIIEFVF